MTVSSGSPPATAGESLPEPTWHRLSPEEALEALSASPERGLSAEQAAERLARDGPNRLPEPHRRSAFLLFLAQFTDFMVLVLVAAAVLAGIIGEPQDSIAIGIILLLNAAFGFAQTWRAERALDALRTMTVPSVRVRRAGQPQLIPSAELVPGDLVLLEAGNLVPADIRLTQATQLQIEEAALTGEALAVTKLTDALPEAELALGDRRNMAYRGTMVSHGHGEGVVVATGSRTELGRIAALLVRPPDVPTPLQRRLGELGQRLALGALAVCALVLLLGVIRGEAVLPMLLTAISLAVAAIPESLPAVVSAALALGARRMAKERALVRQLPAVETLGSVTSICVDKTGTLTLNRMRMTAWWCVGREGDGSLVDAPRPMIDTLALCHDVQTGPDGRLVGEATEVALLQAAVEAGLAPDELLRREPRIAEFPFTPTRARMTTVHRIGRGVRICTKGSPEQVVGGCTWQWVRDRIEPLDRELVTRQAERLAGAGLRVLAVAGRELAELPELNSEMIEEDQVFFGLVGLEDPPRPEVPEAIAMCRSAGIAVVMITGDHPVTARQIASRLGILDQGGKVLTGAQLAALSPAVLDQLAADVRVYARVAPEQKLAIIEALRARGEVVAMTGDGINDAPALRRADIGIAMGKGGTDVAREAAHLVLLDDNFATIVSAVRAGRRIYDNIRRFVRYAVTCNAAEIATLLLAPLLALPIPLLPIHLLWINLVTDGLPGLALAAEPAERQVMSRPPRAPHESIFAGGLWQHIVWVGFLMAAVTLATQAWTWHEGNAHWRTMTFTVLALSQMGHVLAIRSERESLFRLGWRSNPALIGAVLLTVLLQLGTIYLPGAAEVFKTERLSTPELLLCLLLSTVVFAGVEIEKWLVRSGRLYAKTNPAAP